MDNIYQFNVGAFDCLALLDGGFAGKAEMLFGTAPEELLGAELTALKVNPEAIPSAWTCLLVQSPEGNVLIDTGVGEHSAHGGQLITLLNKSGVQPEQIERVILTHIHGDHILGCVSKSGELIFSRAQYFMSETEWQFWTTETTLASAPDWAARTAQQVLPKLADKLIPVVGETDLLPGITIVPAPGHTVGHIVVRLTSKNETLWYLSDTALHPLHLKYPEWTGFVDQDPAQTAVTRRRLFARLSEEDSQGMLFHFLPFPGLGTIEADGDAWRWKSAEL